MIGDRCPLRYIGGRAPRAVRGLLRVASLNQKVLVEQAFEVGRDSSDTSVVLSKQVRSLTGSRR